METREDVQVDVPATLDELVAAARQQMAETGYAYSSRSQYGSIWKALQRFAREVEGTNQFSVGLAERFLAKQGYPPDGYPHPMPQRLKRYLEALRLLTEFQARGYIQPTRWSDRRLSLCAHFRAALAEYEQACLRAGQRPATLRNRRQHLPTLLLFLQDSGIEHLSQIRPSHMSDFLLAQQHHCPGTISVIASIMRCFLRYLHQQAILRDDISATIPAVRHASHAKIPSIWTAEEVERLLAQVDRGSPRGKRDYAILLLAARLGMRVGDIVRLRLEHLHWDEQRIELPQSKTSQPLILPLTEEVGWALIDYLRQGRPAVPHRQVFLWCVPPYEPFVQHECLHYVITRYRRRAGIAVPPRQRSGLHSLRHSLASRLLSRDVPLTTIASILGHTRSESTSIYTKVDLPHLQACALDPEEVRHA